MLSSQHILAPQRREHQQRVSKSVHLILQVRTLSLAIAIVGKKYKPGTVLCLDTASWNTPVFRPPSTTLNTVRRRSGAAVLNAFGALKASLAARKYLARHAATEATQPKHGTSKLHEADGNKSGTRT